MSGDRPGKYRESRVSLDAALLDPTLLRDEIVLEDALGVLEGHLKNTATDKEALLTDLMSMKNLFEFAFSGLSDEVATATKEHISSVFPSKASAFDDSFASKLLTRLSVYFLQHDIPDLPLAEHYRWVRMSGTALKSLTALNFTDSVKSSSASVPAIEELDDPDGPPLTQKVLQRYWKSTKRAASATLSIDAQLFAKLKLDPPSSAADVTRIEGQLLDDLKDILMDYLNILRKPSLTPMFKGAYITLASDPNLGHSNDTPVDAVTIDEPVHVPSTVATEPVPYTNIQPLKAVLNFDLIEGFGDWHILVSTRAQKDLRDARRRDAKRFIIYVKKMRELSNGHFSDDNQKRLAGTDSGVDIFEAKMTGDSRLVYQIDCIREFNDVTERQVIKLFGIYTHAQLKRDTQAWSNVSKQLSKKGKEYRKRCRYRVQPANAGDKVFSPAVFPLNTEDEDPNSSIDLQYLPANEQQDLHERLVLEKFATFSQAFVNNILAEEESAHIFHMSTTEQDIVTHLGSCYVLGRSGTGKTTTMLFKMLGIEQAVRAEYDEDAPRPRQLFVTQSRVLAEKVEEFYRKLVMEQDASRRTARESTKLAAKHRNWEDEALVDEDEEELYRGSLPRFFSELTDDHFPLFITFDHLCRLLEADLNRARSQRDNSMIDPEDLSESMLDDPAEYMLQRRKSFVSYITFLKDYWQHLPQNLTKSLDPALVFAEIMGVIKGSEESILTEKGFLDRDMYTNMSYRRQATFATRREVVYSLFEAYTKKKQERREWDAADRTHSILRDLREFGVQGTMVDFLYVDEAQDNLLVDALVLRSICPNTAGQFWAGDTAQTISAGSSFRFEDLKAFLFRVESSSSNTSRADTPQDFQLAVNYRSHGGIVNVARSVVQLITQFWPHAIDTLSAERGIIAGVKPTFFTDWNRESLQYEQFLFGASGNQLEFGAYQCILVRDDVARDALRKQVGDIGTILTLYESKGLEFNDVLLYNFFEDSPLDISHWRVILNALPHSDVKCPSFDENRHNGLCRELKFLYVAITRARQNLWIADCSDKGEPLRTFWSAEGLIENVSAAENVPRLATTSSSSQEWGQTAKTLFHHKNYSQASRSFERAGMLRQRDVASAYHRREIALRMPFSRTTVSNGRRQAFWEAAEAYSACASASPSQRERLAYHRNAALCFTEASEMKRAGEAYILAEEYTKAAQAFRQGGYFDEAVETVHTYSTQIRSADANKILDVARLHYCKEQDLDRIIAIFDDVEEALEFMDNFGFNSARIALLERCGRLAQAAEIYLEQGQTVAAIHMFMRHSETHPDSLQRARTSLLQGLWQQVSFGAPLAPTESASHTALVELLRISQVLIDRDSAAAQVLDEIAMFETLVRGDVERLRTLSKRFMNDHHNVPAALLCLDHIFRYDLKLVTATLAATVETLEAFNAYTRALHHVSLASNPLGDTSLQRLVGYCADPDSPNTYRIPRNSFLYRYINSPRQRITYAPSEDGGFSLTPEQLMNVYRSSLRERLWSKIVEENGACSRSMVLRLCPASMLFGHCEFPRCEAGHNMAAVGPEAFELRVRGLMQQVLIHRNMDGSEHGSVTVERGYWLSRLYHTLFPIHGKAGSVAELDFSRIPEAEQANRVIKDWIRHFFWNARFADIGRVHFLTVLSEMATLAFQVAKDEAQLYFSESPCIASERPPKDYLLKDGYYVVNYLLQFLGGNDADALSAGVLFVKAVCDMRLSIDANVLCNIVEQLCSAYSVAYRLQSWRNSHHDLTLTRKWVERLCSDNRLRTQSNQLLRLLVDQIPVMLRELFTGSSRFILWEREYDFAFQVRHILVARICKSFSLLGYNIPDGGLRNLIQKNISTLRSTARYPPDIFQSYLRAYTWGGLVYALRNSGETDTGNAEELINLREASSMHGKLPTIRGTRIVVYHDAAEIPDLLHGTNAAIHSWRSEMPGIGYSLPTSADQSVYEEASNADNGAEQALESVAPPDEEDTGIDINADLRAAAEGIVRVRVEQAPALSKEELEAAAYIAYVYRRILSRRRGIAKKGAAADRNRSYLLYSEGPFVSGLEGRYRKLYLGALPLVWVSLESMVKNVASSKKTARLHMRTAEHTKYEELVAKVNHIIEIEKSIRELKAQLEPKSALHRRQSIAGLCLQVEQVAALAKTLPSVQVMTSGAEWELETALRAVQRGRRRTEKPSLVVDF